MDQTLRCLLELLRTEYSARSTQLSDESWREVLWLADQHRVTHHLPRHLDDLPDFVTAALADRARANALRSLALVSELSAVTHTLSRAGIDTIALKGPALSWRLYHDVARRACLDLDLLIHREDVPAAIEALAAQGYQDPRSLTEPMRRAYLDDYHDLQMLSPNNVLVELHWAWAQRRFALPDLTAECWAESGVVTMPWGQVRTLSPHHELLFSSVHGAKHAWAHLDLVLDVAALVELYDVDWERLEAESRRTGLLRILHVTLALARVAAPTIRTSLRPAEDPNVARLVSAVYATWQQPVRRSSLQQVRFDVSTRERWQDRYRLAARSAFTPTPEDWAAVMLPNSLFSLYRIVRVLRLSGWWRQSSEVLQKVSSDQTEVIETPAYTQPLNR
jgi:hypothetical protein